MYRQTLKVKDYILKYFLVGSLILTGCAPTLVIRESWEDGNRKEIHFEKKMGDSTIVRVMTYSESGVSLEEINYKKGKIHGTLTRWHENSKKLTEQFYSKEVPIGKWKWWDEEGRSDSTKEYSKGVLNGLVICYDNEEIKRYEGS